MHPPRLPRSGPVRISRVHHPLPCRPPSPKRPPRYAAVRPLPARSLQHNGAGRRAHRPCTALHVLVPVAHDLRGPLVIRAPHEHAPVRVRCATASRARDRLRLLAGAPPSGFKHVGVERSADRRQPQTDGGLFADHSSERCPAVAPRACACRYGCVQNDKPAGQAIVATVRTAEQPESLTCIHPSGHRCAYSAVRPAVLDIA